MTKSKSPTVPHDSIDSEQQKEVAGMKSSPDSVVLLTPECGVKLHPAIAELSRPHLQRIKESIMRIGQIVPVVVHQNADGELLLKFGATRWLACRELGIACKAIVVSSFGDFRNVESEILAEYQESLHTRGLLPIQKALDAARFAKRVFSIATRANGVNGRASKLASDELDVPENAIKDASLLLGTEIEALIEAGAIKKMADAIRLRKIVDEGTRNKAIKAARNGDWDTFTELTDGNAMLDDDKKSVPQELVPIFKQRSTYKKMAKMIQSTAGWLTDLQREGGVAQPVIDINVQRLNDAAAAILAAAPSIVCPDCKDKRSAECEACNGTRWQSHYRREVLCTNAKSGMPSVRK